MTEPSESKTTGPIMVPPRKPRRWPWITALPVALAAGGVIGFTVHQPDTIKVPTAATVQKEQAMDARAAKLDQHWKEYQTQYDKLGQWEADLEQRKSELGQRESELDERKASLDEREADISQQEEIVAQNTVSDGVWTVGTDLEPGTYRASDVPSDCYWAITTTGSNGADIIQNGIPSGGNPSVTLSEGQDFTSQRCGEWHLQKQ